MNTWVTKLSGILILTIAISVSACSNTTQPAEEPAVGGIGIIDVIDPIVSEPTVSEPTVIEEVEAPSAEEDALRDRVAELEAELERARSEAATEDARDAEAAAELERRIAELEAAAERARREAEAERARIEAEEALADRFGTELEVEVGAVRTIPVIPYQFAFVSKRGESGATNVYTRNTRSDSEVNQLTANDKKAVIYMDPSLNHDGSQIAYTIGINLGLLGFTYVSYGSINDVSAHQVIKRDGKELFSMNAEWAPASDEIVFIEKANRRVDGRNQLTSVANVINTESGLVTPLGFWGEMEAINWNTSDDSEIAYFTTQKVSANGKETLEIMQSEFNVMSGTYEQLDMIPTNGTDHYDLAISPDGKMLAYVQKMGEDTAIFTCKVRYEENGQASCKSLADYNLLTLEAGRHESPCFTRDSQFILFASDRDGDDLDIYMQRADGSEPALRLTDDPADDYEPACGK